MNAINAMNAMKTELDFIRNLKEQSKIRNPKSKIHTGIGDDCAVLRQNSKKDLVVTADLLVEEIDFRLEWTTAEFLGQKALAVSLSDIAAMGATPTFALVSIGIPKTIWETDFVEKFYNGWLALAETHNVKLIGGDISQTPDKIVIDSIALGEVKKNQAVLRSGARIGDLIFVTGKLGGASAGLKLLENGERWQREPLNFSANLMPEKTAKKIVLHELDETEISALHSPDLSEKEKLILRQLRPQPPIHIGKTIGKKELATAMIDLSDGLSSDLAHLCEESNVGARIYAEKIPVDENIKILTENFDEQLDFAFNGGEDFELLFTVAPKNAKKANKFATQIGEIVEVEGGIMIVNNGEKMPLDAKGFRHF